MESRAKLTDTTSKKGSPDHKTEDQEKSYKAIIPNKDRERQLVVDRGDVNLTGAVYKGVQIDQPSGL